MRERILEPGGDTLEFVRTPTYRANESNFDEENPIKNAFVNGILLVASLCVTLAVSELTLRLIGFSYPVFYTYDDVVGTALRPGAEGWNRTEGEAFVKISSAGMRDREHSKAKAPDTVRIAVLGDSMAEALQVPVEKTFWSIMERRLKECNAFGSRNVEVMNFGVSGYGTAQELLTLRHRVSLYSPDMVVLAFYPGNDIRNNSRDLETMKLRPFFRLESGALVRDDSFLANPEYLSYKRSFETRSVLFDLRTFQLLRRTAAIIKQMASKEARSPHIANLELGLDQGVFLSPKTEIWRNAWDLTERLIVKMRDEAAAMRARFLVVSIPIAVQANPDPEVRDRFRRDLGADDLLYPEKRLRALAEREKIDLVLLAPAFQTYAETNKVYLHGFKNTVLGSGHLNEIGHRLAGDLLSDHICRSR